MDGAIRYMLAFLLSAIIGGVVQQAFMSIVLGGHGFGALVPLLATMLVLSIVYMIIDRYGKTVRLLHMTTAALLAAMLVVGAAALVFGKLETSPGIGGNIAMAIALLFVVGFLLPCAVAALIHWWLLRRRWRTQVT
ncbi:MAG: hypothetical protein ACJ8DQ_13125 [Xanthobacteraceae bacterium]